LKSGFSHDVYLLLNEMAGNDDCLCIFYSVLIWAMVISHRRFAAGMSWLVSKAIMQGRFAA